MNYESSNANNKIILTVKVEILAYRKDKYKTCIFSSGIVQKLLVKQTDKCSSLA